MKIKTFNRINIFSIFLLVGLCTYFSPSGANQRGPWSDKIFQPDMLDGHMHLREGIAMIGQFGIITSSAPVLSTSTCDAVFLFAITANKLLSQDEMEDCAMQLYAVHRVTTGENRNLNDVFVKRDVVDQFSKAAMDRMEQLKSTKKFYFRAPAVSIDPFNIRNNSIKVRANISLSGIRTRDRVSISYRFDEPRIMPNDSRWFESEIIGIPIDIAREIESARTSNRFIYADNIFKFEVLGAQEINGERLIRIQIKQFSVFYKDSKGNIMGLGFGTR